MRGVITGIALASVLVVGSVGIARADVKDAWITAKTKIALMTTDNLRTSDLNVDTVNGVVTLHGKVPTNDQKDRADQVAKTIDGVKSVKNLLQVVSSAKEAEVEASDDLIKANVDRAFKANARLSKSNIHVASVNKGVVLISGSTDDIVTHLQAIEAAYMVKGVRRVSTEVTVNDKSST